MPLSECKRGFIVWQQWLYWSVKEALLQQKEAPLQVWFHNVSFKKPHNILCINTLSQKRSKLKNFAPKILLCAERGVLSIRNANIVSDGKAGLWQKPLSTYLLLAQWCRSITVPTKGKTKKTQGYTVEIVSKLRNYTPYSIIMLFYITLCFSLFFPLMGACCAQIKGFTLGRRELVLVRPNVKPFV